MYHFSYWQIVSPGEPTTARRLNYHTSSYRGEMWYDIPYLQNLKRDDTNVRQKETHRLRERTYGCLCVLVPQSCPTLCSPVDCSPPGSSIHGILQARILELVCQSILSRESLPVHTAIFKRGTNKDIKELTRCHAAAWMEGEFGREWTHVYVWLNPFAVHLKLSQHC